MSDTRSGRWGMRPLLSEPGQSLDVYVLTSPHPGGALCVRRSWHLPVRCWVEWGAALALLVASVPLVLLIAALIKLSPPGPVFYAQTRLGWRNRVFYMYKLRTMVDGAERGTG